MQDCERQLVDLFFGKKKNKQSDVAPKHRVFICSVYGKYESCYYNDYIVTEIIYKILQSFTESTEVLGI